MCILNSYGNKNNNKKDMKARSVIIASGSYGYGRLVFSLRITSQALNSLDYSLDYS
jgi:hypothetical protein